MSDHPHSVTVHTIHPAPLRAAREFFKTEASGGVVLLLAAIAAIVLHNSDWASLYDRLLTTRVEVSVDGFAISKPLVLWINDGLMAIFFFLVGLELKREIVEGELSTRAQVVLPAIAALGGMMLPAAIYAAVNWGDPVLIRGWAIPAATDIAFALGLLMLLGRRVPLSLKVFVTTVAVLDDLGAIVIIALFYSGNLAPMALLVALVGLGIAALFNRWGVVRIAPYILVGLVVWASVLKSGVHATLAGVALAMMIPMRGRREDSRSPLRQLEHALHPWVAFLVLPIFAFANAGVSFTGLELSNLVDPLPLGIAAGLVFGKQLGVFGATWAMVRSGAAPMLKGATWPMVYAASVLCGIGFTMSLFIGGLAFEDPKLAAEVRIGVLTGSFISGIAGYLLLRRVLTRHEARRQPGPAEGYGARGSDVRPEIKLAKTG